MRSGFQYVVLLGAANARCAVMVMEEMVMRFIFLLTIIRCLQQVLNRYGFRYVGVCMGWMMVRLVTALYAAMRGSVLLTRAVQSYLVRHGYVRRQAVEVEQGSARMIALCGALAATGVYWQLSGSFTVGFPLNVILVPVTVAEGVVTFVVAAAG